MTVKRNIVLLLLTLLMGASASFGQSADKTLEQCAERFRKAPSLTADFSITGGADHTSGSLTLAGECFKMTTPELSTWYDGKTQWSYMPSAAEVNITEPTPEELAQVNPFAIINSLRRGYTAKKQQSPSTVHKLVLTARNAKADIKRVDLTLDAKTLWPTTIVVYRSGAKPLTIRVSNVKTGKALPAKTFRYNAKDYPGVEVVDLR